MFTGREDVEATALRAQGWSISAIARHLGRCRETVRNHLNGTRVAGERKRSEPDPFEPFVPYLRARLAEDPHVWATALYDEVVRLGFPLSYPSFTRGLRARALRPHCEACAGVKGRPTIEIDHPPGEEVQWDWVELAAAPWGGDASLLVGSLPCSGKFRGVFSESEDQAHLISAMDEVLRRLGGTARRWRVDRMASVINPESGQLQASFVPVAKHYSVTVVACPPRRANRKGSVEKSIHYATGRFWRTMTATTMAGAQAELDRFCERIADRRPRPRARLEALVGPAEATRILAGRTRPTVADLAAVEKLAPLPSVYPAELRAEHVVGPSALVAFEGNAYSVPHELIGTTLTVRHRLGTTEIEVTTASGRLVARHHRAAPGSGAIVRDGGHRHELEAVILRTFTTDPPCRRKANRPPGEVARAEAAKLLAGLEDHEVVVSLADYQLLVEDLAAKGRP